MDNTLEMIGTMGCGKQGLKSDPRVYLCMKMAMMLLRDHMERKPLKHKASIHEFDWEGMEFEKLQEKTPKHFDRHVDSDEPGPSVLRKKNRRYFGHDWDNGVESDDHQDGCSSQETCIAQFPRRTPVVYQVDREMMVNDHLEENALQHFDGHAAPDEQEVSSSDEEWMPQDEGQEATFYDTNIDEEFLFAGGVQ